VGPPGGRGGRGGGGGGGGAPAVRNIYPPTGDIPLAPPLRGLYIYKKPKGKCRYGVYI